VHSLVVSATSLISTYLENDLQSDNISWLDATPLPQTLIVMFRLSVSALEIFEE